MEPFLVILTGVLWGCAIFCFLRRSITRLIIGILLLSHGANFLVFLSGGAVSGRPGIIDSQATELLQPAADPLPQALVLTAIVIGFGFFAFALALIFGAQSKVKSGDINDYNQTDSV